MKALSALDRLKYRARMNQHIRAFFSRRGYLEVDTPLLATSTNTDVHIQSVTASVNGETRYLQTSPEFYMKRLLVEGSGSIFQICHAFRDGETGHRHSVEFSLLEWYSLGFDYQQLMNLVEELIVELMGKPLSFKRLSYFTCFAGLGLDLNTASTQDCRACVSRFIGNIDVKSLHRDDCLDLLISQVISKEFDGFTFVLDYPASQASLARIKPGNPGLAERFELFYQDLELANGFTELADAGEQRKRFEQDNRVRQQRGLIPYPIDEAFLQALQIGLPDCAGVAVGLDRLMMVLLEQDSIDSILALQDRGAS